MNSNQLMESVDRHRRKQEVKVSEFCKGICSTRNYSRYLSSEVDVPFDVFVKMVERLGSNVRDFVVIIENEEIHSSIEFAYFNEYVRVGYYHEAEQLISKLDLKKIPFNIKNIHFPIAKEILDYKLNRLTSNQFNMNCKKILNYDKLLKSKLITKEEAESLILFLPHAAEAEQKEIFLFLYDFINENKDKLLSSTIEITLSRISNGLLAFLLSKDNLSTEDRLYAKNIIPIAFKLVNRDAIEGFLIEIFGFSLDVLNDGQNEEAYNRTYFSLLSLILTRDERILLLKELAPSEDMINKFIEILSSDSLKDISFIDFMGEYYGEL